MVAGDRVAAIPQPARDRRRHCWRRSARRHLHLGLARLRRAGCARPLRPDRTQRCCGLRRLLPAARRGRCSASSARSSGSCRRSSAWSSCPTCIASTTSHRAARAPVRRLPRPFHFVDDIEFAQLAFDHPLHHVLLNHRRPEVHRALRRRRAAAAPEGAQAARRREAGRPRVLLHHLRLDDVELAGLRCRRATRLLLYDGSPFGGQPDPVRLRAAEAHDPLRHLGQSSSTPAPRPGSPRGIDPRPPRDCARS